MRSATKVNNLKQHTKVLVAVLLSAGWANAARLVEGGRFIETHTACGPVRGAVDGPDQFTFTGIPYAVPVTDADRFTHSRSVQLGTLAIVKSLNLHVQNHPIF